MNAALRILAQAVPAKRSSHSHFLHLLTGMGIFGLFLVSIVDASFVPLPIPGITDILLVVFAAQHTNWLLLLALSTFGSAIGGWLSLKAGRAGGMQFLEKRVPARILKPVCDWMEQHAILSVALPAILPPPMPLAPFVLAAGALNMSTRRFMVAFTASRGARHALAIWLGIRYGRHVLRLWNSFSDRWATTILAVLWTTISLGLAIAFWKLWKTSRDLAASRKTLSGPPRPRASA
jgi:membrane protein YqaA with SNARE-associated domain